MSNPARAPGEGLAKQIAIALALLVGVVALLVATFVALVSAIWLTRRWLHPG